MWPRACMLFAKADILCGDGRLAVAEARRYGQSTDKAGRRYDGFGNVVRQGSEDPVYNQGNDEDRRKALDSIYDYIKTLITLATGTVALSATFLAKDMPHSNGVRWLVASWIVLGASICAGIIGMGQYIGQYAESNIKPRRSGAEYISLVQVLALLAGLAFLAIFAVVNTV